MAADGTTRTIFAELPLQRLITPLDFILSPRNLNSFL
jgi:hypothetical protein